MSRNEKRCKHGVSLMESRIEKALKRIITPSQLFIEEKIWFDAKEELPRKAHSELDKAMKAVLEEAPSAMGEHEFHEQTPIAMRVAIGKVRSNYKDEMLKHEHGALHAKAAERGVNDEALQRFHNALDHRAKSLDLDDIQGLHEEVLEDIEVGLDDMKNNKEQLRWNARRRFEETVRSDVVQEHMTDEEIEEFRDRLGKKINSCAPNAIEKRGREVSSDLREMAEKRQEHAEKKRAERLEREQKERKKLSAKFWLERALQVYAQELLESFGFDQKSPDFELPCIDVVDTDPQALELLFLQLKEEMEERVLHFLEEIEEHA